MLKNSAKKNIVALVASALIITLVLWINILPTSAQDTQNVTTTVSVNNSAPTFQVDPYEEDNDTSNPSTSTTPTNQGDAVVFKATGDDQDSNNYYLAICKTNSITPNTSAAPTCGGGAWCVSTSTADGVATSCSYTTLTGDSEDNVWYGFVCDHSSNSKCSSVSQGTGDSGSPFVVNHKPSFTALAVPVTPQDPGSTFTFNSTASDTDTYGTTDDNLYLLVCASAGVVQATPYSQPICSGTQLNLSSASLTNPTTTYATASVYQDGTYTGYGYVYDQHYLLSSTTYTGANWVVNNIAPTVAIGLISPTDLLLTESITTELTVPVTITDSNTCRDITSADEPIYIDFYGNWLTGGHSDCDSSGEADGDVCYPQVTSCVIDTEGADADPCSSSEIDDSIKYICTVDVQYYAEATGVGSQHVSDHWDVFATALDNNSVSDTDTRIDAVNIPLLIAFSSGTSIDYGALDPGNSSASNATLTVSSTGNTNIDTELYGTNMTSGANSITVDNQEFSTATFVHGLGTDLTLAATPYELELNVPKTYWSTSLQVGSNPIYWSLFVPAITPAGTYTGTNTITAVQGEW